MKKKSLLFEAPSACHENLQTEVENKIYGRKTDQNVSEQAPLLANPVPISAYPFSQHWWLVDKIKLASAATDILSSCNGQFYFINNPSMLRKWVRQYGDLLKEFLVCLALLSTSDFQSYVWTLGKLWCCYITQKLFSPNPGTYSTLDQC